MLLLLTLLACTEQDLRVCDDAPGIVVAADDDSVLGWSANDAVVFLNDHQQQLTREAYQVAGLDSVFTGTANLDFDAAIVGDVEQLTCNNQGLLHFQVDMTTTSELVETSGLVDVWVSGTTWNTFVFKTAEHYQTTLDPTLEAVLTSQGVVDYQAGVEWGHYAYATVHRTEFGAVEDQDGRRVMAWVNR